MVSPSTSHSPECFFSSKCFMPLCISVYMPFTSFYLFLSLQTPLQFLSLKRLFLPPLSPPTLLSARSKQPLCLSVSFAASETGIPVEENCFRNNSFLNCLSTTCFGRFLIWSPRLPSTHDVVSHNFGELPIGAVCVADVQFKGRGRSKNVWESPRGCLLFSFTIQMEDGRVVPIVQYVVSLAMTEAIKDVCHKNGIPHLDVRIKWPNDLYLNGLKVGGILCTSTYKSKKFNISAGIGLNIDNEKPTTCLNAVLQKLTSVTYRLQREDILAAFFNKFETLFDLFIDKGFQPLEQLYYETWLHSGQRVIVQEKDEDQFVEKTVTIQGLTSSGYLLAVGEEGQMCELHPDGNSFDCFKGLVRRKLT